MHVVATARRSQVPGAGSTHISQPSELRNASAGGRVGRRDETRRPQHTTHEMSTADGGNPCDNF
jgi:hypothetical protein